LFEFNLISLRSTLQSELGRQAKNHHCSKRDRTLLKRRQLWCFYKDPALSEFKLPELKLPGLTLIGLVSTRCS